MLKKTVKYEDFEGNIRQKDLYFYISKTELAEMETSTPGGFANKLQKITEAPNGADIIETFKEIILTAYGEKSEDGERFIKKRNGVLLRDEFEESLAFDALFSELIFDPDKAAAFVNSIMPKDVMENANKLKAQTTNLPSGK